MWLKLFKNEEELSKRFLNVHPTNYFRLIVQDTFICISRFQNRQPVYRTELVINDGQFQALDILLNSFPSYPVYIILKGQESHFRVVSFMASRWWHRRSLLKQAEEGEFSETDWVHAQPISSVQDTQRYLLVGVSPGMFLQELVNNLQYLSNPLIGIQLWLIVFADQVFKILKRQNNQINGEWVMIVRQQKPGNWQLIVCHQQVVIFHREGKLSTREAVVDLTGEVTSTMRYLSRHGYQQGDPITLIQIGVEGILKLEKFQQLKVINLESDLVEDLPIVSPFHVPKLKSHHLAFILPQNLIKGAVIGGLGLLIASGALLLNNYFQQQTYNFFLKQQLSLKLPAGSSEQLRLSQLFQAYQLTQSPDPLPVLRQLGKNLPPYSVATDLNWTPQLGLTLSLVIDKQALNRKQSADSIEENLRLYQEEVLQAFYKFDPASQLRWGQLSNDFKCSLKITYPSNKPSP